MILGLHHMAVSVPDLDKALTFYEDTLGFTRVDHGGAISDFPMVDEIVGMKDVKARFQMMSLGNAFIEVWEYENPAPRLKAGDAKAADHGYPHIALRVDDVVAEHKRLSAAGMEFFSEPLGDEFKAAYGRDPFGNIIEILEAPDTHSPAATTP